MVFHPTRFLPPFRGEFTWTAIDSVEIPRCDHSLVRSNYSNAPVAPAAPVASQTTRKAPRVHRLSHRTNRSASRSTNNHRRRDREYFMHNSVGIIFLDPRCSVNRENLIFTKTNSSRNEIHATAGSLVCFVIGKLIGYRVLFCTRNRGFYGIFQGSTRRAKITRAARVNVCFDPVYGYLRCFNNSSIELIQW